MITGSSSGTETIGSASAVLRRPLIAVPAFDGAARVWFERSLPYDQSRAELQDLLGAVRSPDGIADWGDAIIQFAELLARKHGYFPGYVSEDAPIADHIEVLLRRRIRDVFRDEAVLRFGDTVRERYQRATPEIRYLCWLVE
jgi:hypothetical protein